MQGAIRVDTWFCAMAARRVERMYGCGRNVMRLIEIREAGIHRASRRQIAFDLTNESDESAGHEKEVQGNHSQRIYTSTKLSRTFSGL